MNSSVMPNTLITQLNNPAVMEKLNRRGSSVASILLVIACAYVLANFTWMLFPQPEIAQKPVMTNIRSNSAQLNPQAEFQRLTRSNLLGVAQSKPVVTQQEAPETRLNLTLKGVLAATPMRLASAIIAEGNRGDEEIYTVGDSLSGGVLVKEIHADFVLLERNGQLEKLKLPKDADSGIDDNTTSLNSLGSLSAAGSATPGEALKEIRSDIMQNPTSFADYAVPVVVKEHGKQIGYRLQPQAKGDLLSKLGIQSSDVITEVNGVKLDKQENAISVLRKLSTASNLDIVVKRNGADVPLSISLQ